MQCHITYWDHHDVISPTEITMMSYTCWDHHDGHIPAEITMMSYTCWDHHDVIYLHSMPYHLPEITMVPYTYISQCKYGSKSCMETHWYDIEAECQMHISAYIRPLTISHLLEYIHVHVWNCMLGTLMYVLTSNVSMRTGYVMWRALLSVALNIHLLWLLAWLVGMRIYIKSDRPRALQ